VSTERFVVERRKLRRRLSKPVKAKVSNAYRQCAFTRASQTATTNARSSASTLVLARGVPARENSFPRARSTLVRARRSQRRGRNHQRARLRRVWDRPRRPSRAREKDSAHDSTPTADRGPWRDAARRARADDETTATRTHRECITQTDLELARDAIAAACAGRRADARDVRNVGGVADGSRTVTSDRSPIAANLIPSHCPSVEGSEALRRRLAWSETNDGLTDYFDRSTRLERDVNRRRGRTRSRRGPWGREISRDRLVRRLDRRRLDRRRRAWARAETPSP